MLNFKRFSEEVELNESHFKVGDKVKCIHSGKEGVVTKVDPSEKGKYYTVKRDDGEVMQYAPDDLEALKESVELGEATDFRKGDLVYQVGSRLVGTVLHKGNRDLIAVKFGSINQMIPASKLRLAESVELDEAVKTRVYKSGKYWLVDVTSSKIDYTDWGPTGRGFASEKDAQEFAKHMQKSVKESVELDEGFALKDVKMAIGIASDKRYAGGNMTGAVIAIEKIKKGLSDHPQVKAVLKRQNESLDEAKQKIHSVSNGKLRADVIKLSGADNEGDPYIVKLFKNGKHYEPADYFTDDKVDAIGTAKMMVKENVELDELDSKTYRSYHDKAMADQLKRMDKEKQTDKDRHTMRKRSLGIATAGMKQYGNKSTMKQRIRSEEVELDEAGSSTRYDMIKQAARRVKAKQAVADKKAMQAAKRDMKAKGAQRGMAPVKKDLDEALQSVTKIKFDYKDTMPKDPKPSDVGGLKQDWNNDRMTVRDAIKPLGGLVTDSEAPSRANKFVGTLSIGTRGDARKLSNSAIQKAVKSKGAEIQNNQFMSESVELGEGRNEALKALEALVKSGGIDKASFQKAYDLYKANKLTDLRKHIYSLDTDPGEEIVRAFNRKDSKSFDSMYPRAKPGEYFRKVIDDHGGK